MTALPARHRTVPRPVHYEARSRRRASRVIPLPLPGARGMGRLVGHHVKMQAVRELLAKAAPTECTIMIEGATGTGKSAAARTAHELSERRHAPFVQLDCASLPETMLEAELLGQDRGAFPGAAIERPGVLDLASGGTLFIDGVERIPLELQARLARIVGSRRFLRPGALEKSDLRARLVVASSCPFEDLYDKGQLRADLLHELDEIRIRMPALRERMEDIPLLAERFLGSSPTNSQGPGGGFRVKRISARALRRLCAHDWPGNVRELQNSLKYAVAVTNTSTVQVKDLPAEVCAARQRKGDGERFGDLTAITIS